MNPDMIERIRAYLSSLADDLRHDGYARMADEADDIRAFLPPDPGGAMPDPWPGMLVEDVAGERWTVGPLPAPNDSGERRFVRPSHWTSGGVYWQPETIREVRSHDGRVLWRAA